MELVSFDIPKNAVSGKILVFGNIFGFPGGKLGPKTQTLSSSCVRKNSYLLKNITQRLDM